MFPSLNSIIEIISRLKHEVPNVAWQILLGCALLVGIKLGINPLSNFILGRSDLGLFGVLLLLLNI